MILTSQLPTFHSTQGCLLLLGTWSHLWHIQWLCMFILWFSYPWGFVRCIVLYLCHLRSHIVIYCLHRPMVCKSSSSFSTQDHILPMITFQNEANYWKKVDVTGLYWISFKVIISQSLQSLWLLCLRSECITDPYIDIFISYPSLHCRFNAEFDDL
jgi:hypothetical protein